jgi:hypothetical protein
MSYSEMLRLVALVRTDVSEELSVSIMRVTRMLSSSETSALTKSTRRIIPEDDILHDHRRENIKSYISGPATPISSSNKEYYIENKLFRLDTPRL